MNGITLTRKQIVLSLMGVEKETGVALFAPDSPPEQTDVELALLLPLIDFHEMGEPHKVTVRILPGDALNEDDG